MARRKNKQSRKYIPKNEFRYNNSPLANGHPHYVFGQTRNGKKYKSLGVTTHPQEEHPYVQLSKNPNPHDDADSYLQMRVHTADVKYYGKQLSDWEFADMDKSIVRQRIKRYKKSTNRKKRKKKK